MRCRPTASRQERQERQTTNRQISLVAHNDDDHFIINMHAFHNAGLIRKALPRSLVAPTPLYNDSRARHFELAVHLREAQTVKRATTKSKAAATCALNKAKKGVAAARTQGVMPVTIDAALNDDVGGTDNEQDGNYWGSDEDMGEYGPGDGREEEENGHRKRRRV